MREEACSADTIIRDEACSADTIIRDEDALREPYVREGEQILTKIIDALKSGTDLSTVKNIAYLDLAEFSETVSSTKKRSLSACASFLIKGCNQCPRQKLVFRL